MKTAIFAIALFISSSVAAWNPAAGGDTPKRLNTAPGTTTSSRANIFGGYDYSDSVGRPTGNSRSNIFGGYDYSTPTGRPAGSSRPNIFGGYDYTR